MARPRTITDERLLEAAGTVIGRVGPGFTLAQVAAEAGVAVGTVAQRFGSKNGLLQALSRLNTESVVGLMRDCGELADPVEALRAAVVVIYEGLGTAETAANHLGQLGVDLGDPELRALLGDHFTAVEAELRRLMRVAARDLPGAPGAPGVVRAARVLLGVANGAALDWSIRPKGRIVDRMGQDVDAVLTAWKGVS
ncbi:TetR/AcrR family transcriptional regulator [Amycolatopsis umgeniensis]|uniref:AcrR family transcriptional regulator n=1 Tax=Amycolatopsis umgeniensis TaxID=336628 RepID=A0A841B566_9PSEU|nr:TetR/AcrR family transcriptional regulator [Amycolatopsis umgeniensis]MBB5853925.1 AcrR family transcriptional regulator [Amycolatopsis umgeniensis]